MRVAFRPREPRGAPLAGARLLATLSHPLCRSPRLPARCSPSPSRRRWQPDKNQGNAEANDLFIKVAKAYEVLTDDATRENYEKYGNPDGYHGTSVTIGLPSWLTNKDNELAILVAYFLIIIVVIPVIVGLWWRNSSKFLEDGVMQSTAFRFYRQVQENTATKYVPGILATAVEFCEGAPCKNATADDLSKLHRRVSPHFVKNQGDSNNDIMKIKTLLYAHLLREPVPPSLQADMDFVLEHSHHLLNGKPRSLSSLGNGMHAIGRWMAHGLFRRPLYWPLACCTTQIISRTVEGHATGRGCRCPSTAAALRRPEQEGGGRASRDS